MCQVEVTDAPERLLLEGDDEELDGLARQRLQHALRGKHAVEGDCSREAQPELVQACWHCRKQLGQGSVLVVQLSRQVQHVQARQLVDASHLDRHALQQAALLQRCVCRAATSGSAVLSGHG